MYKPYSENYFYMVYWIKDPSETKSPINIFNSRQEAEDYKLLKSNPDDYDIVKGKHQSELIVKPPRKIKKKQFESRSHRRYSQKSKNK